MRAHKPMPERGEEKQMILATIRMTIPVRKVGEALRILKSVAEHSKVQPGCLGCRIYRNGHADNILLFEQQWSNNADLENYLQSNEYQQVLFVLEMAMQEPEVRFDTIMSSTGIETIEKAREHGGR